MSDERSPTKPGASHAGGPSRILILVFWVWLSLAVVGTAVVVFGPHHHPSHKRFRCQSNLSQLAGLFIARSEDPDWRPRPGQALLLEWRRSGSIPPGQESVLICPGDMGVSTPDTPEAIARYDSVDLDDPPDDLCSYAVRDFDRFPPDPGRLGDEVFAACVGRVAGGSWHGFHKGGFVVVFFDGTSRFVEWTEVGVEPSSEWDDPARILGPESPVPWFRVLCFRPPARARGR